MNKTPKSQSKTKMKMKMKPINRCLPKHQFKSSNRKNGLYLAVQGSPKTINYSKIMKKYGNMMDESNTILQSKKEEIVNRRKVSYDIDPNNKSTRSKLHSTITPSFKNTTSHVTSNTEDYSSSSIKRYDFNLDRDYYNEHDLISIDSKDNAPSTNPALTIKFNEVNDNNKKLKDKLTEKVGIMLKLFHKYSFKLYQLINSCNDNSRLYISSDIFEELKLTINQFYKTVSNDKLYSMFNIQKNINANEEEKFEYDIIDLVDNNYLDLEFKSNKVLIEKYENQIKILKENNDKLKNTIIFIENKENEIIKHLKEKSEIALNENINMKANNEELKEKNIELQEKIKCLLKKETGYKNQATIISELKNEIVSLKTDVKFKDTTINYLEDNLQKLKVNPPSLSNNNESENLLRDIKDNNSYKYNEDNINHFCNVHSNNVYDFPKQIGNQPKNKEMNNNQNLSILNDKDMKPSNNNDSIRIYGSRNSTSQRSSSYFNNLNHNLNHNPDNVIGNLDDLEPYLTNKLNKQIDNDLIGILSQDNQTIPNYYHIKNSNENENKKAINNNPDTIQKEIDVLDKEISSLKYKLRSIIS